MNADAGHFDELLELEARHDDLLARLDSLDKRVEQVLAQYLPTGTGQELVGKSELAAEGRPLPTSVEVARFVDRTPEPQP
jgi:hypothetical protein